MIIQVALYARVSSEQQTQTSTIDSQIIAIQERIKADGYSGSILMRPGLERLRDAAANRQLNKIYVHSPDRLARKYAYQCLLIEEFNRCGVEVVFLNNQLGQNPESDLLLQVQGIIAEYERMKIIERSRRGKLHAARQGSPSVLSGAPYGYSYTKKQHNGVSGYSIIEEEAEIIRLLFSWVGYEGISINEATNKLTKMGIHTPNRKNTRWNAYKGQAAFGKNKCVPKKLRLRPYKGQPMQPKTSYSVERMPKDKWILISVPAIVDEALFEAVQQTLEENKRLKRIRATGVKYLLQGLVVCNLCKYGYYSCGGSRPYANRDKICNNKSVYAKMLEVLVWEEVKHLLNNPFYLEKEYQRRKEELEKDYNKTEFNKLNTEKLTLEKRIARLIDSYTEELIGKSEFEPRIKKYKQKLSYVDQQLLQLIDKQSQEVQLQKFMEKIEEFAIKIKQNLENMDWQTKRGIITTLIKRIGIGRDEVDIVFKVDPYIPNIKPNNLLEDCRKSGGTNASTLFHSLQILKALPPQTLVYAGHSYGKMPGQTLQYVLENNSYLHFS